MRLSVVACLLLLAAPSSAAEIVFYGEPIKRVSTSPADVTEQTLTATQATEFAVTIIREGNKYLWASRENNLVTRTESGSYVTFHAQNGSGYVRIYKPHMYELMSGLSPEQRAGEVGYMEHLVLQFSSITYFGDKK